MVSFETPRLIISDHEEKDLPDMHKLLSDEKTMRFLPDILTRTYEESRANLEEAIRQAKNPDRKKFFFKMVLKGSGTYVGDIGYTVTGEDENGKSGHFGYFLLPAFHGQGYTTEASRAVLDSAFHQWGVSLITTGCDRRNTLSEKIMIKLGMTKVSESETRLEYRLTKAQWDMRRL